MLAEQQHIVWLDIAVHDALLVRVGQRIHDLVQQANRLRHRKRTITRELLAQRLTLGIRHDVVEKAVRWRLARIDEREDVGMREVRGDGDLSQKARGAERADEIRAKDLERDEPVVLAVARQIDGRHSAMAELSLDVIAVGERGTESLGDVARHDQRPEGGRRSYVHVAVR